MIRYALSIPASSPFTRLKKESYVWIDADYNNVHSVIYIEGHERLIKGIPEALEQSRGRWERWIDLGAMVLPPDLHHAMQSEYLQPFSPRLVEGAEALGRERPPLSEDTLLARRLGDRFCRWLIIHLPPPYIPGSFEGKRFLYEARQTLDEWGSWRLMQASVAETIAVLANLLAAAWPQELERLGYSYRKHSPPLVSPGLSAEEIQQLSAVFVNVFDAGFPAEDLIPQLQERLRSARS